MNYDEMLENLDNYIPSTAEVKFAYVDRKYFEDQMANVFHIRSDEEVGAEFDRWLNSVVEEARQEGEASAKIGSYGWTTISIWSGVIILGVVITTLIMW